MESYFVIGPIGSRHGFLTFGFGGGGEIYVATGCFSGTVEEFEAAVKKTHGESIHAGNYMAAIEFFKGINDRRKACAEGRE